MHSFCFSHSAIYYARWDWNHWSTYPHNSILFNLLTRRSLFMASNVLRKCKNTARTKCPPRQEILTVAVTNVYITDLPKCFLLNPDWCKKYIKFYFTSRIFSRIYDVNFLKVFKLFTIQKLWVLSCVYSLSMSIIFK